MDLLMLFSVLLRGVCLICIVNDSLILHCLLKINKWTSYEEFKKTGMFLF